MENRIRNRRKELGLSQEELAKKCGVSRQTVNAIENNKYDPTLALAFNLAKELQLTVDELFHPGNLLGSFEIALSFATAANAGAPHKEQKLQKKTPGALHRGLCYFEFRLIRLFRSNVYTFCRCRRGRDRSGRAFSPCGRAVFSRCRPNRRKCR